MAAADLTPKLAGATIGAAFATLIVSILEVSYDINLEPPIEGAIATIFAFLGGLFISDATVGWLQRRRDAKKAEAEASGEPDGGQ